MTTKPLFWVGNSKKDLMALPLIVRKVFGHALHAAQLGEQHEAAKVMHGFGDAGVLEVVENDTSGTYRAVYTVRFAEGVFVLHCFQKKSKTGIATPKEEIEAIRAALKSAKGFVEEMRNAKNHH
jgi:phage-related protein